MVFFSFCSFKVSCKCTKFYFVWTPFLGPAKKHRIPDEETNLNTAYHEAGHTLVAYYTKDSKNLHKVTIIPRGQALGYVSTEANLIYCRCLILYLFRGDTFLVYVINKRTTDSCFVLEGGLPQNYSAVGWFTAAGTLLRWLKRHHVPFLYKLDS